MSVSDLGAAREAKVEPFPTVGVSGFDGSITHVPAELAAPGIAIVACLTYDDEGRPALGGGFSLTHVATGKTLTTGQACIECARETVRRLAATGVDWPGVDPSDAASVKAGLGAEYETVIAALRQFLQCQQQMCFHDGACDACGMQQQHASYCIHVVGPMVARSNAAAGV